jgi:uncharacterized membrane protein YphA (DoxX/SURF4 family)
MNKYFNLTGRLLLASLFIVSSVRTSIYGFDGFHNAVKSKDIPLPFITAIVALSLKLIGGLLIVINYNKSLTMLSVIALVIFTRAITDNIVNDLL